MAVKSRDEILQLVRARVGDDTSDEAIAIIEDITDTLDDYEARIADSGDWKARFEQNDAEWRQKYKDRFFNKGSEEPEPDTEADDEKEVLTFDDLFEVKEN